MRNLGRVVSVLALFVGACSSTHMAVPSQADDQCASVAYAPDVRIAACTALIGTATPSYWQPPDLYAFRGQAWADKKDKARALADADKAVQLAPNDGTVLLNRALIYLVFGEDEHALADLKQSAAAPNKTAGIPGMRAPYFVILGDYHRAVSDFSEAIRLDPEQVEYRVGRGSAYVLAKNLPLALADLNEAIRIDSALAEAFMWRGKAYHLLQEDTRALADLSRAIELDDKEPRAFAFRADVFFDRQDYGRAMPDVDTAARLGPEDFVLQANRCSLRLKANLELETALSACDDALRIMPNDINALSSRGVTFLKLGKHEEAKVDFDNCLQGVETRRVDADYAQDRAFCLYGRGLALLRSSSDVALRKAAGDDLYAAVNAYPDTASTFSYYGLTP